MDLKRVDISKLILDMEGIEPAMRPNVSKPEVKPVSNLQPSDYFDIRHIKKMEAKKFSPGLLQALIQYTSDYLENRSQDFLYKTVKGRKVADFEEAGVNAQIKNSLDILKQEYDRRN